MDYPQPLVTISLEEYNSLKQARQQLEDKKFAELKDVMPYKKAISAILGSLKPYSHTGVFKAVIDAPNKEDVNMVVTQSLGGIDFFEVHCEFKDKGK